MVGCRKKDRVGRVVSNPPRPDAHWRQSVMRSDPLNLARRAIDSTIGLANNDCCARPPAAAPRNLWNLSIIPRFASRRDYIRGCSGVNLASSGLAKGVTSERTS